MVSFSEALVAAKQGKKIARTGWNGKGMWVTWTPGSIIANELARSGAALLLSQERPGEIVINGHLDMKSADGSIVVGWLASQTDLASDDWEILA